MRLRGRPQQHMLGTAWPRNPGLGARAPARSPLVRLPAARGFPGTRLSAPRQPSPTTTAPHGTRHGDHPAALGPTASRTSSWLQHPPAAAGRADGAGPAPGAADALVPSGPHDSSRLVTAPSPRASLESPSALLLLLLSPLPSVPNSLTPCFFPLAELPRVLLPPAEVGSAHWGSRLGPFEVVGAGDDRRQPTHQDVSGSCRAATWSTPDIKLGTPARRGVPTGPAQVLRGQHIGLGSVRKGMSVLLPELQPWKSPRSAEVLRHVWDVAPQQSCWRPTLQLEKLRAVVS